MTPSARFLVEVEPGRSVEVLAAGPADGLPLVFHTGTPSGLASYEPMVRAAAARGMRLVCYTRPGYGASGPQPGRRVADAATDVAAILDQLGARHFVTAGSSGGGPHALACAAMLPGRCLAAASLAGVAPFLADDLDWLAGMGQDNVAEFDAAEAGEATISAFIRDAAVFLVGLTGERVAASLGDLASAADRAVLTGEYADYMAACLSAAVSTGIAGWRDDDLAFAADWGFAPERIEVPVSIWQGDADMMVPFAHGQWLAGRIPGARSHLLPGHGHLTLVVSLFGDVVDELAELARGQ